MYTHFISPEKYFDAVKYAKLKPVLDETSKFIIDAADLVLPERISKGFGKRTKANYNDSSSTSPKVNAIQPTTDNDNMTPEDVLKEFNN